MLERNGKPTDAVSDDKLATLFRREVAKCKSWLANQPNFAVLEISYNELLANPEDSIRNIEQFLGGGLDLESMRRVIDPSLYRNRR
jgi:hypothetical protein